MHKIENLNGWNGREWRASLPGTCGIPNDPLVCPQRAIQARGKMFPNLVKTSNGMFWFLFWTIYRKYFNLWVFSYSLKINFIFELIPFSFPNAIGSELFKVVIHSYRIDFGPSCAFLHLYLICVWP